MEEDGDLMKHLTNMTALAEQLREMQEDISSKKFATVVLGSLPESYDNFLTSLNARKADELEWDSIKALLVEEYLKRKDKKQQNTSNNALFVKRGSHNGRGRFHNDKKGKNIICFKCNKPGHIAKNCSLNKGTSNNREEHSKMAEGGGAALISSTGSSTEWYADSAATKHMTNCKDSFINYTKFEAPTSIYLGDDTCIKASGQGMVKLFPKGDNSYYLELHKVLYVPKLAKNLLSVPAMTLMGAQVSFDKEKCIVSKDGKEFEIGKLAKGMLYTVENIEYANATSESSDIWHERFGHLNSHYISKLVKDQMVNGMKCDVTKEAQKECKGCSLGKMHKLSFPKTSKHRAEDVYEIVHSDLCGPMQVKSMGGSRYMITFTDDYSRYTVAYFIKSKDEALTKFKEFVSHAENQKGRKLKILRSDNGGEYRSKEFTKFCADKGIIQQFTCPYTPEQNGVAERLNRTLIESARSMIYHANLPLHFWAEACTTAVYIHN